MPNYSLTANGAVIAAMPIAAVLMPGTTDKFARHQEGLLSPISRAYAAASFQSDTVNLPYFSRAIMVGVAGAVKVTLISGDVVTLPAVTAGVWHWVRAKRIWSTGTVATGVHVGY